MLKLGKNPATHDRRDLVFARYSVALRSAAPGYGHKQLVKTPWGMLGNDQWGDCAEAGPAHETMLWNAAAGEQISFTAQNVLNAYSAITGFNPNDPNTDQGSDVRDVLKYRQQTGFTDAAGRVHKIGAYVSLEPGNWNELLQALYLFESVGVGIEFPDTAMDQFNAGQPWAVKAGATIEGGHYIPIIGRPTVRNAECVTWGAVQQLTKSFYAKYCDEAWAIISEEMLTSGKSLEGFDLATLQTDLAAL